MNFEHPWLLLLLLLIPVVAWRIHAARQVVAVSFSSTQIAAALSPTWRQRLAWLPTALLLTALGLIIISLARPQEGREQTLINMEGIALQMVVDRSSSMLALDFQLNEQRVDRLTAIKHVAAEFVQGEQPQKFLFADHVQLQGRASDLIGLVTFAGFADAVTPPTLDHGFLLSQLNHVQIATTRDEDGTAIGDAIALAVEKLNALNYKKQDAQKIKSKVIILLTDGENNAGELEPLKAAELAQTMGIRIYTIGVGTRGRAPFPVRVGFSGRQMLQWMDVNIDEDTLRKVAAATGGKYFRATDTESLTHIYAEIDQLEKTEIESKQFVDYRELAIQPLRIGPWTIPPLVLLALLCLAARTFLSHLVLREFV